MKTDIGMATGKDSQVPNLTKLTKLSFHLSLHQDLGKLGPAQGVSIHLVAIWGSPLYQAVPRHTRFQLPTELTFMFMGDHSAGQSYQEPKLPSLKETMGGFKDVWKCKWQKLYVCWYANEWKHVFSKPIRIEFRCYDERKLFVMLRTQAPSGCSGHVEGRRSTWVTVHWEHTWVLGSEDVEGHMVSCEWQLLLTSLALAWTSLKLTPPLPPPIASLSPTPEKNRAVNRMAKVLLG